MTPFLALTGATAVGKTELALDIAERIGAEIVSVDSRQIYRQLDIGTATPPPDELARVPHHFVNEREILDPITSGEFANEANDRIDAILARGKVPLVVGGSTLYLTALVEGLAVLPSVPADIADALTEQASTPSGRRALYDELARADPRAASTLDPSKSHRLVRLVGVLRATGVAPSAAWGAAPAPRHSFRVVVLDRDRADLYARIEKRVDAMIDAGLVDENRQLIGNGFDVSSKVLQTIGYREPQAFLRGELTHEEMTMLLKLNTRRYAKRQLTWFRRSPSYTWVDAESATPDGVIEGLRAESPAR